MRTFIVGVLIIIENQYNFIHGGEWYMGLLVSIGVIIAIAQDIKELLK